MINETILYLPQTDCRCPKLKSYGIGNVNWNPDLHLGNPLSKIFSRVIRFEIGESYSQDGVVRVNKRILELVREHSPKYVIWPTMTYEILEETFQEIRKLGAYVVGWFFDDETRFDDYSRWWIPYMDYICTADKGSVARYQQLGAKAYHLHITCEPDDFKFSTSNVSYDVSFVGSKYVADREDWVKNLFNQGVLIETFGKGWTNGFVSHDEMVQIFSNSKINICFTKPYAIGMRNQVKGKIFDITMYGGFLLCEYVEGIESFFEVGKEIVCFNNHAEALEKIRYYLINDDERKMIAQAGQMRANRDWAQSKLLEKVFSAVEKDIEADVKRVFQPVAIVQMPEGVRISHARFHLQWAIVLKKIGFDRRFWRDEYDLACRYDSLYSRMNFGPSKLRSMLSLMRRIKGKIKGKIKAAYAQYYKKKDAIRHDQ